MSLARNVSVVVLLVLAVAAPVLASPPTPFTRDSLQQIQARYAGKPFVLVLWSVYCEPCRAELAMLGPFKAANPGLPVLLVATDPPEDADAIAAMLAEYPLDGVETWAFADAFVEPLRYSIDPRWRGELPRSHLFDSAHRVSVRVGRIEQDQLSTWLRGLDKP